MKHSLLELPFEQTALEPYISAETISFHYGKHHAGYVNKLNSLIEGTEYEDKPIEHIIKYAHDAVYNNAAQIYNHDFYWKGLNNKPTAPSVELLDLIERDFDSMKGLEDAFLTAGASLFGSGWVWLTINNSNKLEIKMTSNADTPIRHGDIPLLTCDVWEHAYYIDYRNGRMAYLSNWWKLVNWNFVSNNLSDFLNNPISGYNQSCNDLTSVCEYVDFMQKNEHTAS